MVVTNEHNCEQPYAGVYSVGRRRLCGPLAFFELRASVLVRLEQFLVYDHNESFVLGADRNSGVLRRG